MTFGDLIDRAIEREGANRVSLASRWRAPPENLYRYQERGQSPKLTDLIEMARRMTTAEKEDLAEVIFGPKKQDEPPSRQDLIQWIIDSAEELKKLG